MNSKNVQKISPEKQEKIEVCQALAYLYDVRTLYFNMMDLEGIKLNDYISTKDFSTLQTKKRRQMLQLAMEKKKGKFLLNFETKLKPLATKLWDDVVGYLFKKILAIFDDVTDSFVKNLTIIDDRIRNDLALPVSTFARELELAIGAEYENYFANDLLKERTEKLKNHFYVNSVNVYDKNTNKEYTIFVKMLNHFQVQDGKLMMSDNEIFANALKQNRRDFLLLGASDASINPVTGEVFVKYGEKVYTPELSSVEKSMQKIIGEIFIKYIDRTIDTKLFDDVIIRKERMSQLTDYYLETKEILAEMLKELTKEDIINSLRKRFLKEGYSEDVEKMVDRLRNNFDDGINRLRGYIINKNAEDAVQLETTPFDDFIG